MTAHQPLDATRHAHKLAEAASELGYEIVDIDGFLGLVEIHAVQQRDALGAVMRDIDEMAGANRDATDLAHLLHDTSQQARVDIENSAALVRTFSDKTKDMAGWVTSVRDRSATVSDTLRAVKANNAQIAQIATQVNTLAINAKIEAARAGHAGLGREAINVAEAANGVLEASEQADQALTRIEYTIEIEHKQAKAITVEAECAKRAVDAFQPAMLQIDATVRETASGVSRMHERMAKLIDGSELIVQLAAGLGGATQSTAIHLQSAVNCAGYL